MTFLSVLVIPQTVRMRDIGPLESIWKLIEKIIDRRLTRGIQFHNALHGFQKKMRVQNGHNGVQTATGRGNGKGEDTVSSV